MKRLAMALLAFAVGPLAAAQQPTIVGFDFTRTSFSDPHFLGASIDLSKLVAAWNREASADLQKELLLAHVRADADVSATAHENLAVSDRQLYETSRREILDPAIREKDVAKYAGGKGIGILVMVSSLSKEADVAVTEWIVFERETGRIVRYAFARGTTGGGGVYNFYLNGMKRANHSAAGHLGEAVKEALARPSR